MEKKGNNQQIKSGDEPRKRTSWLQIRSSLSEVQQWFLQLIETALCCQSYLYSVKETDFINDSWGHLLH